MPAAPVGRAVRAAAKAGVVALALAPAALAAAATPAAATSGGAGNPALTIALALAVGMLAQSVARHLRIPGIVLLLAAGVALGPDGLGIVRPAGMGDALHDLIGFAVAVILFEGGLSLNWKRMRAQAGPLRRLISLGALITAVLAAGAAKLLLAWDWRPAILFGTLVIVTGPTVITPLLRRIKVRRNLETVLETEGVLVDAIGAIVAIVALEVLLEPTGRHLAQGVVSAPMRLASGAAMGLAGGLLLVGLLRVPRLVPEGFENILTLSLVLALFQGSNALLPETGIVSAIVAGMVVGNVRSHALRDLREFKEQLTIMLIGMLFVLLAADVRLAEVAALGVRGVLVVLALMLVVRPACILASTAGAGMDWREKAFLSWVAPRGIVAAAISSLFSERLAAAGVAGGEDLRALVFLVIAGTVVLQGATAEHVARWLGLGRPSNQGYAILGAQQLGRLLGRLLHEAGETVVLIEADAVAYREAEEEDYRVVYGNALDERVLMGAGIESRRAAISVLANGATSLLFVRKARHEYKVPRALVAVQRQHGGITPAMVEEAGAELLFGTEVDIELWNVRLRREIATACWFALQEAAEEKEAGAEAVPDPTVAAAMTAELAAHAGGALAPAGAAGAAPTPAELGHGPEAGEGGAGAGGEGPGGRDAAGDGDTKGAGDGEDTGDAKDARDAKKVDEARDLPEHPLDVPRALRNVLVPLLSRRGDRVRPVDASTRPRAGEAVAWLLFEERRGVAEEWLAATGWSAGSSKIES